MNNEKKLIDGMKELSITAPIDKLMQYLMLLEKWNRAYNLTAIKDIDSMITLHLLDSLAITPWIKGQYLLDVGSGAGLPGIPLAIVNPQLNVVLLDSNGKKIRFLQEIKRQLNLPNITTIHSRAEDYKPSQPFDTVTSRAFSALTSLVTWTNHLVAPGGIWLAMKGQYPFEELKSLNLAFHVENYTVPGLTGQRCCVIIDKYT